MSILTFGLALWSRRILSYKNIPLRNEDFGLIPYIMSCPTSIQKGTPQKTGQKSIRYIKNISNGIVICVEVEGAIKEAQMANITMWAETSSYTNAMVAGKPASYNTSETTIISSEDIAKIINDAETAIINEDNSSRNTDGKQFSTVSDPLQTSNGTIYGFAEGNKITLSEEGMNPNTPVNEYTHLWARAVE